MESKDIIKALAHCTSLNADCRHCDKKITENCINLLMRDALFLIYQQQADIERLKKARDYYKKNRDEYQDKVMFIANLCDEIQAELETAKIEAYKEFADRLCEDRMPNDNTVILAKCLLKELTERKED